MIILAGFCAMLGGVLFIIAVFKKRSRILQSACYLLFMMGIFAISPINNLLPERIVAPSQIVYRFDEHRYILLTGYRCEGRAYFIDDKEQVYTELAAHSRQVFTEPYYHPAKNYISMPLSDVGEVDTSIDGGRTFNRSRFTVGTSLNNKVKQYTVVNDQAFILTHKGQLYASESPFGSKSYWLVSKEDRGDKMIVARNKTIPDTIPPIPDKYSGWDKMRCDYRAKGVVLPNPRTILQVYQQFLGTVKQGEQ